MEMMRQCVDWMMSFGLIGMALGVILLGGLVVLVVMLISRLWRGVP